MVTFPIPNVPTYPRTYEFDVLLLNRMAGAVSFFDLPAHARRRVYAHAGLARPCWISLRPRQPERESAVQRPRECLYRLRLRGITEAERKGPACICPQLPLALLLVCKAVYTEAFDVLYGQNRFVLRAHSPANLGPLPCMSTRVLATMRSLMLRLNCWPCRNGHDDFFR